VRARPGNDLATKPGRAPNSEGDRHSRSLKCSFGLIGEADLGRFIPNFSQFITMAGEEQWHDMQIGDTFEGTAFDKPVRLIRRF
jgi:hypothetical protein